MNNLGEKVWDEVRYHVWNRVYPYIDNNVHVRVLDQVRGFTGFKDHVMGLVREEVWYRGGVQVLNHVRKHMKGHQP